MSKVYFTSDLHFNHKNLCNGLRHMSPEESNNLIISNWNKIITYADKRWSNGNVYIKNGWTYIRDSNPSYDYIDQYYSYRINRLSMTKKKIKEKKYPEIFDDNKTEKEMTEELGLSRIWNCGNMVFEYIKK